MPGRAWRRAALACMAAASGFGACKGGAPANSGPPPPGSLTHCVFPGGQLSKPMFHGDRARTGWNSQETVLTPDALRSPGLGPAWDSAPFDTITLGGTTYAGRMYASLLYADDVPVQGTNTGYDGQRLSLLFAATANGFVYAVNASFTPCQGGDIQPGTFIWKTMVGQAAVVPLLDNSATVPGIALGVLSTPVIDLQATPPRIYVTAGDAAGGSPVWKAYALDVRNGAILPGWPVTLSSDVITPLDTNGAATFDPDTNLLAQRGALALSPSGDTLYIVWGGYSDHAAGWAVGVDTAAAKVVAAFCAADGPVLGVANGGLWEPGGPAVDGAGQVYLTAGNGPASFFGRPHAWGNSFVRLSPSLTLNGSYSPWNYCQDDNGDTDLGGDSPILLPDLDPASTATPHLVAFGSKQGTVYLLDRDHLPGNTTTRPPCAPTPPSYGDAAGDTSLLPPAPEAPAYCDPANPGVCGVGPLSVFGPYSDDPQANQLNMAKMRSTPALFRGPTGEVSLFVAGSTKNAAVSSTSVPPSMARLRLNLAPGAPAYLSVDAVDTQLALLNPGSPVVSSNGPETPVVWVVDQNAQRLDPLLAPDIHHPVLYAVDGVTLEVLWQTPNDRQAPVSGVPLAVGGKYVTPVVAHGVVFVGTDRVQAFSIKR